MTMPSSCTKITVLLERVASAQPPPPRMVLGDLTNVPIADATVDVKGKGKAHDVPPPPPPTTSAPYCKDDWTRVPGWSTTSDDYVLHDKGMELFRVKRISTSRTPRSSTYLCIHHGGSNGACKFKIKYIWTPSDPPTVPPTGVWLKYINQAEHALEVLPQTRGVKQAFKLQVDEQLKKNLKPKAVSGPSSAPRVV
jgi:hypothetical protein